MNHRTTILGALAAAGALTLPLLAQQGNTGGKGGQGQPGQQPGAQPAPGGTRTTPRDGDPALKLKRGEKVIGIDVQDSGGGRLGRIEDLVVRADGTIAYAIVAAGDGKAGMHPVPWRAIRFAPPMDETGAPDLEAKPRKELAAVEIDAERWKTAPHFDRWPKHDDRAVFDQSDAYFVSKAAPGDVPVDASAPRDPASNTLFRASRLEHQTLTDASGKTLGRVGRVVIDPTAGRLNYVSVSLDDPAGGSGRTVAMPWQTLRATREGETERFSTSATSEKLRSAPQFMTTEESWKQMSDPKWVGTVYEHYAVRPYWSTTPTTDTAPTPAPAPSPKPPAKPAGAR